MKRHFLPAYLLTFVNILGFSLLFPVLPFIVERYGGGELAYGLLLSSYSFFQFLGAPWLGRLSDSVGRKPVLLISQAGTLLSWLVLGLAWFLPSIQLGWITLPLLVIAGSRVLDGVTGGNVSVTQAYVSDITTHQEKSLIFGTLGGIVGLGMIIGPGLGGFLASGSWGYLGVACCGAALSAVTLLAIQFQLRESLPLERRKPRVPQPLSRSFRLLKRIHELQPGPVIRRLFLLRGMFSVTMASYVSTIALYMIDLFAFTERTLGLFMFVVGFFIAFNQAVVSRWFIRRLGVARTLQLGLLLTLLGLLCITLSDELLPYILFYYVLNLGISLTIPTFSALIAQSAHPRQMGEVMGIGNSIIASSNAVMPVVAASLYGLMGDRFYWLIALLPLLALLMSRSLSEPTQADPQQSPDPAAVDA